MNADLKNAKSQQYRLQATIPGAVSRMIDFMVDTELYGNSRSDVATHILRDWMEIHKKETLPTFEKFAAKTNDPKTYLE